MPTLKYRKLFDNLPDLRRGSACAAGIDLYSATGPITLQPGESTIIPTGVAIEIPEGYFGHVSIRSGLGFKHGLATHLGVVDSDFRGELRLKVFNHGVEPVSIDTFDRVAQLILIPYSDAVPEEVSELSETARGENGYGSTGR